MLYLGHNVKKGGYVLLQFAENRMVEPVIEFPENEMNSDGIRKVLRYLTTPPPPGSKPFNMSDPETKKRLLKIKRECVLIFISLLQSEQTRPLEAKCSELKVIPMHAGRGWSFERHAPEIRRSRLPLTNEQFLQFLRDAFEIAS